MPQHILVVLDQIGSYLLEWLLLGQHVVANFVLEHLLEDLDAPHHLEEVSVVVELVLEY